MIKQVNSYPSSRSIGLIFYRHLSNLGLDKFCTFIIFDFNWKTQLEVISYTKHESKTRLALLKFRFIILECKFVFGKQR